MDRINRIDRMSADLGLSVYNCTLAEVVALNPDKASVSLSVGIYGRRAPDDLLGTIRAFKPPFKIL
jgi:hypothetical protein